MNSKSIREAIRRSALVSKRILPQMEGVLGSPHCWLGTGVTLASRGVTAVTRHKVVSVPRSGSCIPALAGGARPPAAVDPPPEGGQAALPPAAARGQHGRGEGKGRDGEEACCGTSRVAPLPAEDNLAVAVPGREKAPLPASPERSRCQLRRPGAAGVAPGGPAPSWALLPREEAWGPGPAPAGLSGDVAGAFPRQQERQTLKASIGSFSSSAHEPDRTLAGEARGKVWDRLGPGCQSCGRRTSLQTQHCCGSPR